MSRVEKFKHKKEMKKKLYLPLAVTFIFMLFLLMVVDYRVNSALGVNEIRIINIDVTEHESIQIAMLGEQLGEINYKYLKRDIFKLKNEVREWVLDARDYTVNVFNSIENK